MLQRLVDLSLRYKVLVLILFLVVGCLGYRSLGQLPIDAFPDVTPVQVNIYTEASGLAAEDVESLLTTPVESALAGLPKVEEIRSVSLFGLSYVAVYFAAQTPQGAEADPSYWQAGERLYKRGDKARAIPACIACHGPIGRGNLAAGYPALRAQHSVYTVKQLTDYAGGTRYPGATKEKPAGANVAIMATIAKRLSAEEVRDVSSYIQGMR